MTRRSGRSERGGRGGDAPRFRASVARTVAALVFGAILAAMVACAARAPARATQPPRGMDASLSGRPDDLRAQIAELDDQIAGQLGDLDEPAPDMAAAEAAAGVAMAELHPVCERSDRSVCLDVCRLSDSICDNAAAICDLAGQLPGDAWAEQKCNSGKAACQRASARCCEC